eukprot:2312072-Amphidinium_carterae.2
MPFRSWCPICVRAKGRGDYHKGSLKTRSVIQMDYAYIRGNVDGSDRTYLLKVLTMAESITGMCNAVIVDSKRADPYAVAEVKKFILENGFITSILQSDGEPAI